MRTQAGFRTLIFDTLKKLVKDGIDKELIESAIHQIEFHRKEVTNTPYPYGLKLLMGFAGTWLHGGDPEEILELDALMDKLKAAIAREPFLEKCIQTYFLDNPHRVLLTLEPDSDIEEKENQRVAAELAAVAASPFGCGTGKTGAICPGASGPPGNPGRCFLPADPGDCRYPQRCPGDHGTAGRKGFPRAVL